MERKNPFGPEEKTAPSTRNPVLEARPGRAAVAVVEVPTPAPLRSQTRPAYSATSGEIARAEAERAGLINAIDLRLVSEPAEVAAAAEPHGSRTLH